jgi:hypothetical protein
MTVLCANLDSLEPVEVKVATQIGIDTGRRPEDILNLPLDCLARDKDGGEVLVYDNAKANRLGRRLPISKATAEVITGQQQRVRQRFPGTPPGKLKLLPTPYRNPDGHKAISKTTLQARHRDWVAAVPVLHTRDGLEFDPAKVVPYAYRHTYVISLAVQRVRDGGYGVGRARASRVSGTRLCRRLRSPRDRVDQRGVPGRARGISARRRRVVGGTRR